MVGTFVSDFYALECKIRILKEKLEHRESQLKEIDPNKEILEKIRDKADMWDGKESSYYGNKLKEILKEND